MTPGSPACSRVRILLGAFVLGGLRGQEQSLVEAHLAGCAQCRAEYRELAEVPAMLDLLIAGKAADAGEFRDQEGPAPGQPRELAERSRPEHGEAKPPRSPRVARPPTERGSVK